MNFIIELLPKKENSKEFVFVVRAQNGFPISVCDSLEDATGVIADKMADMLKAQSKES